MNSVRRAAAWIYRFLITLFTAAVVVEFFLAGLGVFRAMPGEHTPVSHETFSGKFDVHAALGGFLIGGSLLLLILILVAWTSPRWIGETLALAVLTLVQMFLARAGEDAPVAGAFHVINAVLILGLSVSLTARAWRGNLFTASARVGETGRPPNR